MYMYNGSVMNKLLRVVYTLYIYRITGNVCCDFIFAKVKKRKNLNTCNFHSTCICIAHAPFAQKLNHVKI